MKEKAGKSSSKKRRLPDRDRPEKAKALNEKFDFGGIPDRNLKKNLGC